MTFPVGWPANFQGCTLTGTYKTIAGQPVTGDVTFSPRPLALIDYDASLVILPPALTVTLGPNGGFSILLPATDDPDISPIDWTYQVTENFVGGRSYDIEAPQNTTVDITRAAPVPQSAGNPIVRGPRGLAGGVQTVGGRGFDQNGDVELAGLTPVLLPDGWNVAQAADFREALGLGSSAIQDDSHYSLANEYNNALKRNRNLEDLTNMVEARENLGLSPTQIRDTLGLADAPTVSDVATAIANATAKLPQGLLGEYVSDANGARKLTAKGIFYSSLEARVQITLTSKRRLRIDAMQTIYSPASTPGSYGCRIGYNVDNGDHLVPASPTMIGPLNVDTLDGPTTRVSIRLVAFVTLEAGNYLLYPMTARGVATGDGDTNDALLGGQQLAVSDLGAVS